MTGAAGQFWRPKTGNGWVALGTTGKEAHSKNDDTRVLSSSYKFELISYLYFFPSLRAGGILQILQSDWLQERAVFYDLAL